MLYSFVADAAVKFETHGIMLYNGETVNLHLLYIYSAIY